MSQLTDDMGEPSLENIEAQFELYFNKLLALEHLQRQAHLLSEHVDAESFHVKYDPEVNLGEITLEYEFYDRNMTTDN